MHFNGEIRLSDVLLIGGGIAAFVKMFWMMRDQLRDLSTSLLGLSRDVDGLKTETGQHRDWLIAAGLDRRHHPRRVEDE